MPPSSLNLKAKLSSLALAQSSPSPPSNHYHNHAPTTPTDASSNKRKMFFQSHAHMASSWLKKPLRNHGWSSNHDDGESNGHVYGEEEKRVVQEVLGKMIFQAGVDFETRPMVVLNGSALPDPQIVSYDLLLSRILSYLNLYVEADYTVVFFAAGSRHTPSWNWVWKAYRSLSRKYRKNLKQLYIVHSSFFSKMLFSLAGAIISPKFFRKITYINTLSEVAQHVPLTQIDIPPAVYQENLKYERKITLPTPTRSSVFGVPLEDLMGYDGEKGSVPRVIKDAAQYLRQKGMKDEGLFRRSPASTLLRAAQDAFDRGNVVSLYTFGDPHLAAVLIKKYLRDLPDPIFHESTYPTIKRCPMPATEGETETELAAVRYIREVLLPELVPCAVILLSYILHLLHDVSLRSEFNRMDSFNLAVMISPNLVKGSHPVRDVMMCSVPVSTSVTGMSAGSVAASFASQEGDSPDLNGKAENNTTLGMVVAFCIRRYYEIFDEIADRSEAVASWKTSDAKGSTEEGSGTYVLGEDEDLDDDAHVQNNGQRVQGPQPAAGEQTPKGHKNNNPSISVQPIFNTSDRSSPFAWNKSSALNPYPTNGKARSLITIEGGNDTPIGTIVNRRGSIAIGRGSTRKGSGSAVEAVSVTAEGFFTPPGGVRVQVPTVSLLSNSASSPKSDHDADGEDATLLSVSERKRIFENGGELTSTHP